MASVENNKELIHIEDKAFFGHPKPLGSLFFTEMWERFSFYGIRALIILFISASILDGGYGFDKETAANIIGIFAGFVFLMTIPGGWLADNWLGQKKAVWYGAIFIALGHLSIALSYYFDQLAFFVGLILIVIGSGLFKTCISVLVGDLYADGDSRRDSGFSIFYMGINIGGFIAPIITGFLGEKIGWHLGFGVGGLGMLISLYIFKYIALKNLDRYSKVKNIKFNWDQEKKANKKIKYTVWAFVSILTAIVALVHMGYMTINVIKLTDYLIKFIILFILAYFIFFMLNKNLDKLGKIRLVICFILIVSSIFFWATFQQQFTTLTFFTKFHTTLPEFFGHTMPITWITAINPLSIILFAPLMAFLWMKLEKKGLGLNSIAKASLGMLLATISMVILYFALVSVLESNDKISILWPISVLFLLSIAELCVSPIGMSCLTSLSADKIKGQMMGVWFAASALGDVVAGQLGGNLSEDKIANFPSILMNLVLILLGLSIVLAILSFGFKQFFKDNLI